MAVEAQLTPMMAQYRRIKGELPKDALLLFRLGDFYEMFFEDAQTGAQLLNLALTNRNGIPMCGLPFHAAGAYVGRILRAGRKVAICDQLEEARPGKLVKREVTQILSPGAHFDERILAAERNNFLAAVFPVGQTYGLALADLTTGDFMSTEIEGAAALLTELQRLRPAEIIFPSECASVSALLRKAVLDETEIPPGSPVPDGATDYGWILNGYDDWTFAPESALYALREHFKVATLDGFGLKDRPAAIGAAGGALHYLTQHLRRDAANLTRLAFYRRSDYLTLDYTSLRHLEVLEPLRHDAPRNSSLYGAINRTVTPMGARRLRDWLSQPLAAVEAIRARQQAVRTFVADPAVLDDFRTQLAKVRDLERTVGRISSGSGNARDLVALRQALEQIPTLKRNLAPPRDASSSPSALLAELESQLSDAPDLVELITRAIIEDPPLSLKEGGMIRDAFDASLDELRTAMRDGKDWIARLQQQEIQRTGISSLKVRFNSVFGYYIEVTKANLDKIPPQYIRRQTIANGERYITPELKDMEGKILGAEERGMKLEYDLFLRVREEVLAQMPAIQRTAAALAQLDVLACFAQTARLHNYCQPEIFDQGLLQIREGRHPVLEQNLADERFVPNDAALAGAPAPQSSSSDAPPTQVASERSDTNAGTGTAQIALITGPNMAGKSTYIRQVALITLLAHAGSFVPAAAARIDLVDRVFTRIGASDDIGRGQSTFMVEMCETANILNNATSRSLVILDEIGRGTSTFDGLSLAWSIVEHLHNSSGAKTLFATHYHELTELARRLPRIRNLNVAVREWRDQIVFLRRIVPGGADKSYGIHVARLAGVPKSVLDRAKVILANLEESELTPEGTPPQSARSRQDREKLKQLSPPPQMDLFG